MHYVSRQFLCWVERKRNSMRSILFTKGKFIIMILLFITMFFNRKLAQQLMLAVILIWIAAGLYLLICSKINALAAFSKANYTKGKTKDPAMDLPMRADANETTISAKIISDRYGQEKKWMFQHISLRITEKLKSAYPDATWAWDEAPDLTEMLEGKHFRISVSEMGGNTHADIFFDQFCRIRITPLIVGEFSPSGSINAQPDSGNNREPAVIDVQSWYELIGKQALESIITDLNANGHSRLSIKENGDILITHNKKEALMGTLEHFPPKNYWNELLKLLEEYELHGKAEKDHIIVSWT